MKELGWLVIGVPKWMKRERYDGIGLWLSRRFEESEKANREAAISLGADVVLHKHEWLPYHAYLGFISYSKSHH
jgi:hypothetical protein